MMFAGDAVTHHKLLAFSVPDSSAPGAEEFWGMRQAGTALLHSVKEPSKLRVVVNEGGQFFL